MRPTLEFIFWQPLFDQRLSMFDGLLDMEQLGRFKPLNEVR